MPEDRLKVLIADDHPLVIAGIRRALEHDEDIDIVGEAHSGSELLQLVERRLPGVVLMDLKMPGVPALECIQRIAETWPESNYSGRRWPEAGGGQPVRGSSVRSIPTV